ncbi:hypothetical protein N7476_006189 [Penicillium atrosanguineum]|uniref:Uncharacterized protein n=1 Tax=Penicillium atrosanguineum TaxID=1132637 RepID=A0A9W9PWR0_9EURO|nr:hypothetical protein N7526_009659 [Penicillium atrosanguineum]KAJ5315882.1 hypothetical protein N7476_006189 [Penicillium atrosanguineum]
MSILNANADACPSVIPDADSDGSAQASFVASEFPARIQPTFHAFPFKSISSVKSTFLGRTTSSATRWSSTESLFTCSSQASPTNFSGSSFSSARFAFASCSSFPTFFCASYTESAQAARSRTRRWSRN